MEASIEAVPRGIAAVLDTAFNMKGVGEGTAGSLLKEGIQTQDYSLITDVILSTI